MRAERFGSYSIVATRPGTPNFSRLKSMSRSFCLWPPPWWRIVMSPALRRPPVRCLTSSSGLYGLFVVRSSLASVVLKRSVDVIGLYVLIAIVACPGKPVPNLQHHFPVSPEPIHHYRVPIIFPDELPAFSCFTHSLLHSFTSSLPYKLLTYSGSFSPRFSRT